MEEEDIQISVNYHATHRLALWHRSHRHPLAAMPCNMEAITQGPTSLVDSLQQESPQCVSI